MIIWLIGISGAGKSTVAKALLEMLRRNHRTALLLDGDDLRKVWGDDLGYDLTDRQRNHERISRLCALLAQEPRLDLVVPALSIFPELRKWNRCNVPGYFEVFLDVPLEIAMQRDAKGIYARAHRGEIRDVAGFDIPFPPPESADLVLRPPEVLASPEMIARQILAEVGAAD